MATDAAKREVKTKTKAVAEAMRTAMEESDGMTQRAEAAAVSAKKNADFYAAKAAQESEEASSAAAAASVGPQSIDGAEGFEDAEDAEGSNFGGVG